MAAITLKCPNCGGDLRFDPEKQNYRCEYCLSVFTQEQVEQMEKPELKERQAADETAKQRTADETAKQQTADEPAAVCYTCPSCGAEIVTDETTVAAFCYYCHNPVVLAGKLEGEYHPDLVISFAVDREKALDIFDKWIGGKKYVPKAFYSRGQIEKMTGVYFPYWLYDCQVEGNLEAEAVRLNTWATGSVQYTKTEQFQISRKGRMEVSNVPRVALSKANRKLVESVFPFEMEKLRPFHMGYLSGFMAENRDLEKSRFTGEVEDEVRSFASQSLRSEVSGYNSVQVKNGEARIENPRWKLALLPVWTLTYNDRKTGKIYYFACNGQTGKVCGELPVDNTRLARLFAAVFIPVAAFLLAVGYFLG